MELDHVTESGAEATTVGYANNIQTDNHHYILEVGTMGKVIGGRYCSENENDHPDFLWAPIKTYGASNRTLILPKFAT